MSKVLTFSRQFPSYHPRKGEMTNFVEKLWISLIDAGEISISKASELSQQPTLGNYHVYDIRRMGFQPKYHTVRAGHRWKAGDMFSPRVWGNDINPKSGKSGPYHSKQIIIAPDMEVKKVFDFRIEGHDDYIAVFIEDFPFYEENKEMVTQVEAFETLAKNDGLTVEDFKAWFKWPTPFEGQIISWCENINY